MEKVKKQGVESLFVPYEIALELKRLGFDDTCFGSIDQIGYIHVKGSKSSPRGSMMYNTIDCPTFSQAFRFFRDRYHLIGCIDFHASYKNYMYNIKEFEYITHRTRIETYEEAELACIRKLIEIAKEQNVK